MRYKDTKKISKKQIFREIFGAHPQKRVLVVPPRGRLPCYASAMHGRLKRRQRNFLRKERKDNEHGNTRKNTETDEGTVRITRIKRRQMDRESVTLRETPCSNKNIRSISGISTEQKAGFNVTCPAPFGSRIASIIVGQATRNHAVYRYNTP